TADLSMPHLGNDPVAERPAAAAATSASAMSPCGGECRVGWSHAAARWPNFAKTEAAPDRYQQTIDGGRPLPHRAPHRRLAQFAHPAGRSRMPIALHGLALPIAGGSFIARVGRLTKLGVAAPRAHARTPPIALIFRCRG